jgi:hypothetical protein
MPRLYPFVDPDAMQKLYWYRNFPKPRRLSRSLARIAAVVGVLVCGGLMLSQNRTASQLAVGTANSDKPWVESGSVSLRALSEQHA